MSFRTNAVQQLTLFDSFIHLTDRERRVFKASWAKTFGDEVFPMIDEAPFAVLYDDGNGRPNTPINVIVGALVIKELLGYTDDELVEALMFDLRLQYALHTTSFEEQPLSDKTLTRFRLRCYAHALETGEDLLKPCIQKLAKAACKAMGINGQVRRMDSMMIASNIRDLGRVELIWECVANVCRHLAREGRADLIPGDLARYADRNQFNRDFFHDRETTREEREAQVLADADALVAALGGELADLEPMRLLLRALEEQTIVVAGSEPAADGDDPAPDTDANTDTVNDADTSADANDADTSNDADDDAGTDGSEGSEASDDADTSADASNDGTDANDVASAENDSNTVTDSNTDNDSGASADANGADTSNDADDDAGTDGNAGRNADPGKGAGTEGGPDGAAGPHRRLRTSEEMPGSGMMQSPHDPDATFRRKAGRNHKGYVLNVEESCGEAGSIVTNWSYGPNNVSDQELLRRAVAEDDEVEGAMLVADGAYECAENVRVCSEAGIELVTTSLSGKDPADALADFEWSEDGGTLVRCAAGHEPTRQSLYANGQVGATFELKHCEACPLREQCRAKLQKTTARVQASANQTRRARHLRRMGTEEFRDVARLRNGAETVPSNLRRNYRLDELPRGTVRGALAMDAKIGAYNFRKLLGFHRETLRPAENPLLKAK